MWALAPGLSAARLAAWAQQQAPRAVLVVSPHWMTHGSVSVMTTPQPQTWHDFGGFPDPLYRLQYPAPGAPELGAQALALLGAAGWSVQADAQRPFDHGAWVPLRHMWPQANVPVTQVSLPQGASPQQLMAIGQALAPLRDEGVLLLCTGSMTHNLRQRDQGDVSYVPVFARWVRDRVMAGDRAALLDWAQQAPHAQQAHPSDEHFLPLFIAWGAASADEHVAWLNDEIQFGFLAMDAVAWH